VKAYGNGGTIHNIKLQKIKLLKFVWNSGSGAGLPKYKCMKKSSHEEANAVPRWFNQKQQQEHQSLVPCVCTKPIAFMKFLSSEGEVHTSFSWPTRFQDHLLPFISLNNQYSAGRLAVCEVSNYIINPI
jgi:hypothetical protein